MSFCISNRVKKRIFKTYIIIRHLQIKYDKYRTTQSLRSQLANNEHAFQSPDTQKTENFNFYCKKGRSELITKVADKSHPIVEVAEKCKKSQFNI